MNDNLIDHLQQIAHLFLKLKDQWRSRAFSNVAGQIRVYGKKITVKNGKVEDDIPGVGSAINDVIVQFLTTGTSVKMKKLREKLPDEVLERFDSKVCKRKVNELLEPLTKAGVDWGYAGSMRRGQKTVRDVDVVVVIENGNERDLVYKILEKANLKPDVRNGKEKIGVSIPIKNQGRSFTLDLNFTVPEYRGAYYLYFTGPKALNITMRGEAKNMGLRLNQNGLFKGSKNIACKTEEEIFKALGREYVEPELRA